MTKRNRIIGVDARTKAPVSGIFDLNDVSDAIARDTHQVENENLDSLNLAYWPVENSTDPYYNYVINHITATDTANYSLLTDESSNSLVPYFFRYDEHIYMKLGGPKSLFSTFFREQSYTVSDHSSLRLGTSAFTIRFWIRLHRNHATEYYLMGKGGQAGRTSGTGWVIYISSAYRIGFYDAVSNTSTESTTQLDRDTWHYISFVREAATGTQMKVYVNGVLEQAAGTSTGNFTDTNPLYINRDRVNTASTFAACLFFDLQIWNSVQNDFNTTVPTTILPKGGVFTLPPDQCWNPYNPNWQAQGLTITGSNNDITRVPIHPLISNTEIPWAGLGNSSIAVRGGCLMYNDQLATCNVGAGPFTVEMWLHTNYYGYDAGIISKGFGARAAVGSVGWALRCDGSGNLEWFDNALVVTGSDAATRVPKSGWVHIACVRTDQQANGFSIYVNGRRHVQGTVSSDYSNASTYEIKIGSTRSRTDYYTGICNGFHAVKISKTARYTDNFTVNTAEFYDAMTTVDANTAFLVFTNRDCLFPNSGKMADYVQLGYEDVPLSYEYTEFRTGYKSIQSRANAGNVLVGGHSVTFRSGNANKLLAYDAASTGAFTFGGDFSIEFFYYPRISDSDGDSYYVLIDSRTTMNDTGIAINQTRGHGLEVITNGRVILSSARSSALTNKWQHVCVQRVANKIALYSNGERLDETWFSTLITSTARKLTIGCGSWDKIRYTNGYYGYFSNVRVTKTAPYAVNNQNPQYITVPNGALPVDSNTYLYTACGPILRDYSIYDLEVGVGGTKSLRENLTATYAWDVYVSNFSPFAATSYRSHEHGSYDNSYYGSGFYSPGPYGYAHGWSNGIPSLGFIQRFSRAWTIEHWYWSHETNPDAPTNQGYIRTQHDNASQQGFIFYNHYNGSASSRLDVCFIMICNGTRTNFATSSGSGNVRPHGWNHAVLSFDPSQPTHKIVIFVNGKRVFTTSTVPTPSTHWYTWHNIDSVDMVQGPIRISDIARYNNASPTCDTPTIFKYDKNCAFLHVSQKNYSDISNRTGLMDYLPTIDKKNRLFDKPTLFFPGFTRHDGTYLGGSTHNLVVAYGGHSWSEQTHDTRRNDWCVEFYAQWYDIVAGGQGFISGDYSGGACIYHRRGWLWCGVNPNGFWNLRFIGTNDSTATYQTLTSTVSCATKTSGRFDYVCFQQAGKNLTFYVNGIEQGRLLYNNQGGGYTGGPGTNYTEDVVSNDQQYNIGADWGGRISTRWCGWMAEFRHTATSRYNTKVINDQPMQVIKGSDTPVDFTRSWPYQ